MPVLLEYLEEKNNKKLLNIQDFRPAKKLQLLVLLPLWQ